MNCTVKARPASLCSGCRTLKPSAYWLRKPWPGRHGPYFFGRQPARAFDERVGNLRAAIAESLERVLRGGLDHLIPGQREQLPPETARGSAPRRARARPPRSLAASCSGFLSCRTVNARCGADVAIRRVFRASVRPAAWRARIRRCRSRRRSRRRRDTGCESAPARGRGRSPADARDRARASSAARTSSRITPNMSTSPSSRNTSV